MDHFSYGPVTPALAYAASYIGSLLGLMCASRARVLDGRARAGWLAVAAVSLGGTGIWVMHFIAMMGFSVADAPIRYQVGRTAASAAVAIIAVGAGLAIVGNNPRKLHRIAAAGLLTGIGVAGMHYLGMAAMNMQADVSYEPKLFALSVLIAIVASAVALWFTLVIRRRVATLAAAALMGLAVCGMHYTGMAAMRLKPDKSIDASGGVSLDGLLLPVMLVVSIVTVVLLVFVAFSASPTELLEDARFAARLEAANNVLGGPPASPLSTRLSAPVSDRPSTGRRPSPTPTGTGDRRR